MDRSAGPESGQRWFYCETLLLERAEVFWKAGQFVSTSCSIHLNMSRYFSASIFLPRFLCLGQSRSDRNSKRPGRSGLPATAKSAEATDRRRDEAQSGSAWVNQPIIPASDPAAARRRANPLRPAACRREGVKARHHRRDRDI
jgi:hypothetical protein